MASFSCLNIGLAVVLGFLFMGIIAELYYLLCRKKKIINTTQVEDDQTKSTINPPEIRHGLELELADEQEEHEEHEEEVMGIYNLAGQPRFLFTINEESNEDLESEESRTRRLSDIITAIETPYFTPMASPPLKASPSPPPPLSCLDSYKLHGFNPLFESSPPPKFKFLRDAEEKLCRRLMEEAQRTKNSNQSFC
ncbi:uncharacterized protein LOC111469506 [Cucurbita maxima]|uniref:Uncharacterized protein LOC111469506 n=1 Tax=Cucurbita maxima TaxID=3661 RepID=A0A6J1I5Z4_CUCMA|nr:uncharacterized protein LOC111469506 [Cucurbita maxima]